jgi:hypothetical protein
MSDEKFIQQFSGEPEYRRPVRKADVNENK